MKRNRTYHPSETHLAIYPATVMITCRCGARFAARSTPLHDEDDPELCIRCNRASWSRLLNDNKPVTVDTQDAAITSPADDDITFKLIKRTKHHD